MDKNICLNVVVPNQLTQEEMNELMNVAGVLMCEKEKIATFSVPISVFEDRFVPLMIKDIFASHNDYDTVYIAVHPKANPRYLEKIGRLFNLGNVVFLKKDEPKNIRGDE